METQNNKKNFALIGAAGYVAPRHMQAIRDTGNTLVAAFDPHDSVGILDRYFFGTQFFTEFERFDRHAEKLRRMGENSRIHYVSICSPNYLHDAHIRFALRIGATAICEKPLVLNPWNLDALSEYEKETKGKIFTILQLRIHPSIVELKKRVEQEFDGKKYNVELTYITPRGPWYYNSWKGDIAKSGGVALNIGVHFFDMLTWIFGDVKQFKVHYSDQQKVSGYLELEKADVKWFLSLDKNDIKDKNRGENKAFRSIKINGNEMEFSDGFADLHTTIYNNVMHGIGFGVEDVVPSIELVYNIRNSKPETEDKDRMHPYLKI